MCLQDQKYTFCTKADFLFPYASNITSNKECYTRQLNVLLSYLDIVIDPLHWGEASFRLWSKPDCKLEQPC